MPVNLVTTRAPLPDPREISSGSAGRRRTRSEHPAEFLGGRDQIDGANPFTIRIESECRARCRAPITHKAGKSVDESHACDRGGGLFAPCTLLQHLRDRFESEDRPAQRPGLRAAVGDERDKRAELRINLCAVYPAAILTRRAAPWVTPLPSPSWGLATLLRP